MGIISFVAIITKVNTVEDISNNTPDNEKGEIVEPAFKKLFIVSKKFYCQGRIVRVLKKL